jgi:hypothetical protein
VSVAALIRTCAAWETLPVDVEDHVKPEFLKFGVKDQIWFFSDPKLNPSIIRGEIQHWEWWDWRPETEPIRVADITYAAQMPHEWQRLVCCKEMLHILDPEGTRVTRPEDIDKLVEKIILPSDLQDPFNDGIHALTDRVAITYAAAILFPLGAREILIQPFLDGRLPLAKVAELAELPPRYAAVVMSESWPEIHEMLVA